MKYETPAAFREALLTRLRSQAVREGTSVDRLRKRVVFERLLARLLKVAPGRWALKGALALDFRSVARARATMDADMVAPADLEQVTEDLLAAQSLDLKDSFTFRLRRVGTADAEAPEPTVRFHVTAEIAGAVFDEATIDIAVGAPFEEPLDKVDSNLLAFADVPGTTIPVFPPEAQVAEKLHAYTRAYGGRGAPSTRVKDLVDLIVIVRTLPLDAARLRALCDRIFTRRSTHQLPSAVPAPPAAWAPPFRTTAQLVGIDPELEQGHRAAAACLDPILSQSVTSGTWKPAAGRWIF